MIVITGGAGFIGSNIAEYYTQQGKDIIICDFFDHPEKWVNIRYLKIHDFVEPANLLDYLEAHKTEIEAIIHMGAISSTTCEDVLLLINNNFKFSLALWNYCTKYQKRFIYASSAATYGDGSNGFSDQSIEGLKPLNKYGWSKQIFDLRVQREVELGNGTPRQWVGLKFFNVFGKNEHHKGDMKSVICKLYEKVANGNEVQLFKSNTPEIKDGEQTRDFINVGDTVNVVNWFFEHPKVNGIFNVGTGNPSTFKCLIENMFKSFGKEPKIKYYDMPAQISKNYQNFTKADLIKLRSVGCDVKFTPIEDSVALYMEQLKRYYNV